MENINLYIDCDGVILNTIDILIYLFKKYKINVKDEMAVIKFLSQLDWDEIIKQSSQINNSIYYIKELINSNIFNPAILSHITCLQEAAAKRIYFLQNVPGLSVFLIYKLESKTTIGNVRNKILVDDYTPNLVEWEKAGGIGIKFTQYKKPNYPFFQISSLEELLITKKELIKLIERPKIEYKQIILSKR
ncbi:MAG: hypothetical protein PHY26_01920 [Bacilli bacterium]|nr:hypothetical protein [Bacilli bacterium]